MYRALYTETEVPGVDILWPAGVSPGVLRILKGRDAKFGDKYFKSIKVTLHTDCTEAYIEGLDGGMSQQIRSAMQREFSRLGVKFVRWDHTNNRGHKVSLVSDIEHGGKLKRLK